MHPATELSEQANSRTNPSSEDILRCVADEVLRRLGAEQSDLGDRLALQAAFRQWIHKSGSGASDAAELAIARWREYVGAERPHYVRFKQFFRDGLWLRPSDWPPATGGSHGEARVGGAGLDGVLGAIDGPRVAQVEGDLLNRDGLGIVSAEFEQSVHHARLPLSPVIADKTNAVTDGGKEAVAGRETGLPKDVEAFGVRESQQHGHGGQHTAAGAPAPRPRAAILTDLLAAARAMVENRLSVRATSWDESREIVDCLECYYGWTRGNKPAHVQGCRVGWLAAAADEMEAALRAGEARRRAVAEALARGDAYGFGEPWGMEASEAPIVISDQIGSVIVDMTGSTLHEELDAAVAERIVACVNFCEGVPTAGLYQVPKIAKVRA